MIEVYADYHTPTVVYARDEQGWHIVPSSSDGWGRRRPWTPTHLAAARMATRENRITFYGCAWVAAEALGMPVDRIAVVAAA